MAILPPPGDTVRIFRFLAEHPEWSAHWTSILASGGSRRTDRESDLYAESSDADTVISYIVSHMEL
jgi:hypothetical protein